MPGFVLHVGAVARCTHAATATVTPGQTRVLVSGQPVATVSNVITVAGCPFQVPVGAGTKPQPCVKVQWSMMAGRVKVMNQAVLLQPSLGTGPGICQSAEQIPQGPPMVNQVQQRVRAL